MKFILLSLVGLLSFAGAIVGMLALSGNLNGEALQKLRGKEAEGTAVAGAEAAPPDMLSELAKEVKARADELDTREAKLLQQEAQLRQREEELTKMRTELETIRLEIDSKYAQSDAARQQQLQTIGLTLAKMNAKKAAERLNGMEPEEIADILNTMKDTNRGKILEELEKDLTIQVLRQMQSIPAP